MMRLYYVDHPPPGRYARLLMEALHHPLDEVKSPNETIYLYFTPDLPRDMARNLTQIRDPIGLNSICMFLSSGMIAEVVPLSVEKIERTSRGDLYEI